MTDYYSTNMAAPYVTAVRTALKGLHFVPGRWLLAQRSQTPAVCQFLRLHAAQSRSLHGSSAASLCSSRTGQHSKTGTDTDDRRAGEEKDDEEEGPEYIPKRKARNHPMRWVGYAWMIGLPTGVIGFILTKREVDKNRLKQLKVRQRMRLSNDGEYDGSRYRQHAEDVKLDQ